MLLWVKRFESGLESILTNLKQVDGHRLLSRAIESRRELSTATDCYRLLPIALERLAESLGQAAGGRVARFARALFRLERRH